MKILVVAQHQHDGGSPTAIFIHDQMKEYVRAGHEVRVIAPVGIAKPDWFDDRFSLRTKKCVIDGIPHVFPRYLTLSRFGAKHINTPSAVYVVKKQLPDLLDGFQPDIIHAHVLGFGSCIGAALKEMLDCPLVVTTHGSDTTIPVNTGRTADLYRWCKDADVVVAVSKALEERLRQSKTETEIKVIHNGYYDEGITGDVTKEACSCLQVSNLIELKQIPVTIRAFEKIHQQHPQARLTIIGKGPDRAVLERLCEELNISDVVTFTGQLQHHEVIAHMAKTQFYIQPSVREGLPISYLEAMGMGCVIIGTATEGISEIVNHGVNGFLIQPGDYEAIAEHVCACIVDQERTNLLAEQGKKTANLLTWQHNAQKLVNLFEELI